MEASTLREKLNSLPIKSLQLDVDPTTPANALSGKLMARLLSEVCELEHRKRKCRVILRNLSFQAIEENISSKLCKFGPLSEVYIPRVEVIRNTTDRKRKRGPDESDAVQGEVVLKPRGFGFVTFLCESDAKSAVNGGCTGLRICNREFAIDFCQNKHTYTTDYSTLNGEEVGNDLEKESKGSFDSIVYGALVQVASDNNFDGESVVKKDEKEQHDLEDGEGNSEEDDSGSEEEGDGDEGEDEEEGDEDAMSDMDNEDEDHADDNGDGDGGGGVVEKGDENRYDKSDAEKPSDVIEGRTVFVRYVNVCFGNIMSVCFGRLFIAHFCSYDVHVEIYLLKRQKVISRSHFVGLGRWTWSR